MEITTLVRPASPSDHRAAALSGRFDAFETEAFRAWFDERPEGCHTTSVDLQDVGFVDSSALAELVRSMKHCREAGGDFILENISDPVRVILELSRLDAAFTIVQTAADAGGTG